MNGPDPLRASRDRLVDEAADLDAHGKPAEARAARLAAMSLAAAAEKFYPPNTEEHP